KRLVRVNRQGRIEPLGFAAKNYRDLSLSTDGKRLAVSVRSETDEIWIYDLISEGVTQLTLPQVGGLNPVWSPDGTRVVYRRLGNAGLYWRLADGSGTEEQLTSRSQRPFSWSQSSQTLALIDYASTNTEIWTLPLDGDRQARSFLNDPFNKFAPMFS